MTKHQNTYQKALVIEAQSAESSDSKKPLFFNFNVETKRFGNQDVLALLARELHVELQVGRDFSTWIKDRISKQNFIENQDFILTFTKTGERKNVIKKEYWISIDMAKHLCMLENNERGHQARCYFIEIERRYYESQNLNLTIDESKLPLKYPLKFISEEFEASIRIIKNFDVKGNQAKLSACQMIRKLYDVDILSLTGKKGLISESQQHDFSPTEIGGMLKPVQSARKVNQMLIELGYQIRAENPKLNRVVYQPTEMGESFAILKDTTKKHSDGTPILQVRWFEKIRDFLQSKLMVLN